MDQHLAGMIARSERAQQQSSQTPVLDFDRRGAVYTPGWLEQSIRTLLRSLSSLIVSLKGRMQSAPTTTKTMTQDMPISNSR